MSDGVYADPRGMQEIAQRLSRDVAALRVCPAHAPLSLPDDEGGVTAATDAFLDAEAQVALLAVEGIEGFARRLETTAIGGQQADVFSGR